MYLINNKSSSENKTMMYLETVKKGRLYNIILISIVSAFVLLIFSNAACAAEYYVATYGDDGNTGLSIEQAWTSPSYATQQVVAGDTIYLLDGTWYNESKITFANSGNATHPITMTAYNGTPTIDNDETLYAFYIHNKSNININNLKILNYTYPAEIQYSNNIAISDCEMTGELYVRSESNHIYIDNNTMYTTTWQLIRLEGKDSPTKEPISYIYVTNNTLHSSFLHDILDINYYQHHIYILDNVMYNSTWDAIFSHSYTYGYPEYFTITGNDIYDVKRGIVATFDNSYFANNRIHDIINNGAAFSIEGSNNTYYNNTVYKANPFYITGFDNNSIFEKNNASSYRLRKGGCAIIDEVKSVFAVRNDRGSYSDVSFTDGTVFKTVRYNSYGNYLIGDIRYYPTGSNFTLQSLGTTISEYVTVYLTKYDMTAIPTSGYATVVVNSFDTSLTQGNILVDFTANTTDGNNVAFTVNELQPDHYYLIKKDGTNFTTTQANSTGYIQFSNSEWSEHTFTIEETSQAVVIEVESDTPVSITPSTTQTTPGESFTLTIPITPETPIAGAQFDLNFDNSLATVTSVTEGNLLDQDGATTLFNSGTINNAAGTVTNIYGSILGETSVSSQGSLATISMTAGSTTGYLNLNLANIIISDANSAAAPYTLTNATILIDTAPVLSSIDTKSVDEASALTFTTSASDDDGDSLTYSATNLPTGASLNTATGTFSWTPADGEAGTYVVTFEVTDGYLNDSENVTITVNNANNAPVITTFVPANSLIFNELDVITVGIIASDADGDALTYNIKIDGVTKSTSSNYVWETDYSSAGTYIIDITVSDGTTQVIDSRTITINDVRPRWDVNEDGTVDVLDISMIGQKYGTSVGAPYPRWDVNQDGGINVQDMTLTGSHFGETVA